MMKYIRPSRLLAAFAVACLICVIVALAATGSIPIYAVVLIGFFHSHPDHPARPSEFDREHALPWWSYVCISVQHGRLTDVLSWELREDRSRFDAEEIVIRHAA